MARCTSFPECGENLARGVASTPRCNEKYARVPTPWTSVGKELSLRERICLATWNIGTLTGKSIELVDTMKRRRVNIACLQETKNGVGIIGDRIIAIKLVLEKEIINIISAYAPQIGLDETTKKQFWENMDELVQGIPESESIYRR